MNAPRYLQIQRLILSFQSCGDGRRFHLSGEKQQHNFYLIMNLSFPQKALKMCF